MLRIHEHRPRCHLIILHVMAVCLEEIVECQYLCSEIGRRVRVGRTPSAEMRGCGRVPVYPEVWQALRLIRCCQRLVGVQRSQEDGEWHQIERKTRARRGQRRRMVDADLTADSQDRHQASLIRNLLSVGSWLVIGEMVLFYKSKNNNAPTGIRTRAAI